MPLKSGLFLTTGLDSLPLRVQLGCATCASLAASTRALCCAQAASCLRFRADALETFSAATIVAAAVHSGHLNLERGTDASTG